MEGSQNTPPAASALTAPLTNALAILWGAAAAYILCYSLVITQRYGFALAALVPLIAAWATLERKRWGRMALTGLSMITACPFIFLLAEFAALPSRSQAKALTLGGGVRDLAALYDISATAGFGLVILAGVTWLWMLRRQVKAEFHQNKKTTLANAQCAIATVLVCCWGGAVALTPLVTGGRDSDATGRPTAASPPPRRTRARVRPSCHAPHIGPLKSGLQSAHTRSRRPARRAQAPSSIPPFCIACSSGSGLCTMGEGGNQTFLP